MNIGGVKIKNIKVNGDLRGDFREILRLDDNFTGKIAQVSIGATHPGVIKAFHFHKNQDDIFYVLSGNIRLVLYDGRDGSITKGQKQELYLDESYEPQTIFIPRGVYHGYKSLGNKDTQVLYIMNNQYNPSAPDEERVDQDDVRIGVDWRDKVLVIGAGGFLGQQLLKDLATNYRVEGTYFPEKSKENYLDITDKNQVERILEEIQPDIVILTAAKTNVEACEEDKKDTFKTNVTGVKNILSSLKYQKFVYYSTEAVFDGQQKKYKEDDQPRAINVYGQSKIEAEKIVSQYPDHLILRTSRLYSATGQKFLNKIIESLGKGERVDVPEETPGNFTLLEDLSSTTIQLIKKGRTGTYHVAGASVESFDEAALLVSKIFDFDKSLVHKVEKDFFNGKVKRPACVLDTEKLHKEGIKMSTLSEGLLKIKRRLNGKKSNQKIRKS